MVLVKMLMEIDPPLDERIVGNDNVFDFPRQNGSTGPPRLVLPRFCLETAALHPESFLLIFSRSKHTIE